MRFEVSVPQLNNTVEMLGSVCSGMENLENNLAGFKINFSVGESDELIFASVKNCETSIREGIQSAKEIQTVLNLIIEYYTNTENSLINGSSDLILVSEKGTAVYEAENSGSSTSTDEEIDKKLADDIKKALSWKWKYSSLRWLFLSKEKREQTLKDMLALLAPIYGIAPPKLTIGPEKNPVKGLVTGGYFNNETNEIWINEDFLNNFLGRDDAIHTLLHEMRHAYQWDVINHPENYNYSAETVNEWRYNYNHYISADSSENFASYDSQAIETDADEFADRIQTSDWIY